MKQRILREKNSDRIGSATNQCHQCLLCQGEYNEASNSDDSCKLVHEVDAWRRGDILKSDAFAGSTYYYYALCNKCGEICSTEAGEAGPTTEVTLVGSCREGRHVCDTSEAQAVLAQMELTRIDRVKTHEEQENRMFYLGLFLFVAYWLYQWRHLLYDIYVQTMKLF